jgi:hypothetical protein
MTFDNTYKAALDLYGTLDNNDTSFLEVLKGLPFYYWDKPKDQQQGTFVGTVGLPVKNGVEHGLYDYEQKIIDYLDTDNPSNHQNRRLYILKSAGLGITTLLLYYIGWKCTTNDDWASGRVCILTAPRIELTIDIVDRLKGIFEKWNNDLILFNSRNTIASLNDVKIEAFPAHLGLKGMRGLTDVKMIIYDEAAFFDTSMIGEARDTIERYIAKSNPIIVLCSTPDRPNDLMDLIRQEPEDKCIYHRLYLDYTYGLDKIYPREEMAIQRLSPSWGREYCLQFAGQFGSIFHLDDIEAAIENGRHIDYSKLNLYTRKSLGIDISPGKAGFGICVTEVLNGMVNVIYAEEYPGPNFAEQINIILKVLRNYQMSFRHGDRVFIDGSMPAFINDLSIALGRTNDVDKSISYLKAANPGYVDTDELIINNEYLIPVTFQTNHKAMLMHAKSLVESNGEALAINPNAKKFITSLQTAEEKSEGSLDKNRTSYSGVLDAFRMSIKYWHKTAYVVPPRHRPY